MIIKPKVKGFICTTAHPKGCAENVKRQIQYTKENSLKHNGPKNVLVIGCSTGYGLASRISAAFGAGANTIGIMFEKLPSEKRTATAGYYNTQAFEKEAAKAGLYAKSINGDAFSQEIKQQVIAAIKKDLGKIDLIIYSIAAPKRTDKSGTTYKSVLKTIDGEFRNKNLDLAHNTITEACIPAGNPEEIYATVKVMGGEDWKDWITALDEADVLAENALTIAYSYIGPKLTFPIYHKGTIGAAKAHLVQTAKDITKEFKAKKMNAYVSVNKGLVTQASSAIPIVPLYISILFKVMKEKGCHEGCIEQMCRLFNEKVYTGSSVITESDGMLHVDDYEMREDVQKEVFERWEKITTENLFDYADIDGYWDDFYKMFGFHFDNVDYDEDIPLD